MPFLDAQNGPSEVVGGDGGWKKGGKKEGSWPGVLYRSCVACLAPLWRSRSSWRKEKVGEAAAAKSPGQKTPTITPWSAQSAARRRSVIFFPPPFEIQSAKFLNLEGCSADVCKSCR